MPMATALPDIKTLAAKVRTNDRATLARAITLIESKRADHHAKAHQLVQELLPHTGQAMRVGITGAPGVGKSTTIDTHRLARVRKKLLHELMRLGMMISALAFDQGDCARQRRAVV